MADALSHHPLNPDSSSESEDDDDNWETISYGMVCQSINHLTDSMKIPFDVKYEIQNNEMETSEVNEIIFGENSDTNLIEVQLNELKLFPSIPICKMERNNGKIHY